MTSTDTRVPAGSAERWGALWGARPADRALSGEQQTATYEAALERVALEPGQAVLDIGCRGGAWPSSLLSRRCGAGQVSLGE